MRALSHPVEAKVGDELAAANLRPGDTSPRGLIQRSKVAVRTLAEGTPDAFAEYLAAEGLTLEEYVRTLRCMARGSMPDGRPADTRSVRWAMEHCAKLAGLLHSGTVNIDNSQHVHIDQMTADDIRKLLPAPDLRAKPPALPSPNEEKS